MFKEIIDKTIECEEIPKVKCVRESHNVTVGKEYVVVTAEVAKNKLTNNEKVSLGIINDRNAFDLFDSNIFDTEKFFEISGINKEINNTTPKSQHHIKTTPFKIDSANSFTGAELLIAMQKGEFKIGDKVVDENNNHFSFDLNGNKKIVLFNDLYDSAIEFEDLAYSKFHKIIIDKPKYCTFHEALTSGKDFKHQNWDDFYSTSEVFRVLGLLESSIVNAMVNEKRWIVK